MSAEDEDTQPQRPSRRPPGARTTMTIPIPLSAFATDPTPWLTIANDEDGVVEAPGDNDTARVLAYMEHARGKRGLWFLRDSIAWCACFVGWCLLQAGFEPTYSSLAKSYETIGEACELKPGCIVVLKRGLLPWQRHVGICVRFDNARVWLRGGNQQNRVCVLPRPRKNITATRWPTKRLAA